MYMMASQILEFADSAETQNSWDWNIALYSNGKKIVHYTLLRTTGQNSFLGVSFL